ncbi:MAG: hypothetical protein AAGC72_13485 [Planctomycetota bacterium]
MKTIPFHLITAVLAVQLVHTTAAKEIQGKCDMGRDYWLYLPDRIDPGKTYTLVVGAHGARGKGKGAAGHAGWVKDHDVIVLGPSYPHNGFQYLYQDSDKQTIELFKKLKKEYRLHDKLFIVGFSGGSQYAHRFAMKYPGLVSGCAAHSGGTWATGDYPRGESPNPKARGVVFVISCGENDTKKSFKQAPLGRLEWAKRYEKMLDEGGFVYDAKWWPGVGHSYANGARQQSVDCFVASTRLLPELEEEADQIGKLLKANGFDDAWSLLRKRKHEARVHEQRIIGRVLDRYLESQLSAIKSIDRWAQHQVKLAVRDSEDPQTLSGALRRLRSAYKGLPGTTESIVTELAKLE